MMYDFYSRSDIEQYAYDAMEEMREKILESLSPIQISALFHDFDDFLELFNKNSKRDWYDYDM